MDEINAVIEIVAPFAGGERGAGKLAVHGVEEGHEPGGDEARNELAFRKNQNARNTMRAATIVTMLGVTPRGARKRVAWKAGTGHRCLVTRSVAPL